MKTSYELKNERNNLEFDINRYLGNHNANTPSDLSSKQHMIYTAMLDRLAEIDKSLSN